jgi:hypothetical protein
VAAEPLTPIEHQNVPQAHQGLHSFLYSSDDEHEAADPTPAKSEIPTEAICPLTDWCESAAITKVAGVYAVLDRDRQTQYIGYSRNIALSLRGHLTQLGEELCAFVKVHTFTIPKRDEMEALKHQWIAELESVPSGNASNSNLWASTVGSAAIAAMTEAERQAYDEKKLKLRKAMADGNLSSEQLPQTQSDRAANLEAAVTEDDWSGVVNQQTQETLPS